MNDLWKILEACRAKKMMVRVAMFPGGAINVAIYDNEKQMKQYIYGGESFEQIEAQVKKDFGKLLGSVQTVPSLPKLPSIPPIPGFPRP